MSYIVLMLTDLLPLLQTTILSFFAEDPVFRMMQAGLLLFGLFDVFLLFWTLRDALTRSQSMLFQMFALLTVFALPFAGFLLYLLIRPSSTLHERAVAAMVQRVLEAHQKNIVRSHKREVHSHKKSVAPTLSS